MPALQNTRAGIALVIGVGEYERAEQVETLRFATRDAVAMADVLADPRLCAFPREQVVLLTNGDARRDELVQRLSRWLPGRARGTELVVIYFAGHGMVQTVGRREEGFLLPYDADPDDVVTRGIAMSDIARWIDGLEARAVVVCLDCCHAGKVLGQRDGGTPRDARNMELRPAVLQAMSGQGRYLIASCDEGQKSHECADLGHGLFTFHLLRGIAGEADHDGDGRVGLAELFNYVASAVSRDAQERFGREQNPWTSATWTEETYISSPNCTMIPDADPFERIWREEGAAAAVREIEQTIPKADEVWLRRALRFLGRIKEPAGIPAIFRCLSHASETIRGEGRAAIHSFGWETVVSAVEVLARHGEPGGIGAVLDGLNAFEAHPRVVGLLDRLVVLLKGELRNRTILLLERKRLGLGLESVAALFREIHSPYQIQKVLGQGLFTETYLAHNEETDLEVVIRVLRQEFANQPHVRAAFLDLSKQSVHLIHEKLALTREARAFPDRHIYFAVRDYVPGVTLQRVLETGKRFGPAPAVRILREVAEALTPLQRRAVCHGGIKPSNIFLCEGDRVILGDPSLPVQGIGVALDRLSYDYRYAAPEMFRGGSAAGPQSDFYSLGCVAYELLCGAPPFVSDNFNELPAQHTRDPITPPGQRGSPLGAMGDAIILKLLARSPAERYATLNEVLKALASLDNGLMEVAFCKRMSGPPGFQGEIGPGYPRPLLRDASLMNYQAGQSVLNFEQTGSSLPGGSRMEPTPPLASAELPPQVPGYEILEVLGRGGMGSVYKALDVRLQRTVALKVLPVGVGDRAEQLARFHTEARAIASFAHPNIVQIYSMGENAGSIYLALEYVGGGDLRRKIREFAGSGEQMPIRDAAALTATLAQAVQYAHQHGVLHRDLKPSNILLSPEGQAKIADFGLSKIQEDFGDRLYDTAAGTILGTPAYMSPEQWKGMSASPATDVYALGLILYEMLTGHRPFQGGSSHDLMYRVLEVAPTPLTQVRHDTPPELEAICLRCLEKVIERRYRSAADLADDLEHWLRGEPVTARQAVSDAPSARQTTSKPLREGVAAQPPAREGPAAAQAHAIWQRLVRFLSFRKPDAGPPGNNAPEA
jgi:serine/threonine protein kinase